MHGIFIADAHLRNEADDNYQKLLSFLATIQGKIDTLYILGDLFEFWIGYRRTAFPHYLPVLEQLHNLVKHGTRIVYFEGNHDFHMGRYFTETLRAEVHPGPATIDIDGKRVFLCHGDRINQKDYGYRLLRATLHSRFSKMLIPIVPVALTSFIADRLSRQSSERRGSHGLVCDQSSIIRHFADDKFAQGYDVVICGHFHIPFLERTDSNNGRILLSLGDWINQYSYGEWLDGKLYIKVFGE